MEVKKKKVGEARRPQSDERSCGLAKLAQPVNGRGRSSMQVFCLLILSAFHNAKLPAPYQPLIKCLNAVAGGEISSFSPSSLLREIH